MSSDADSHNAVQYQELGFPVPAAGPNAAPSGAEIDQTEDPILSKVIAAWPSLPKHVRLAISALATSGNERLED